MLQNEYEVVQTEHLSMVLWRINWVFFKKEMRRKITEIIEKQ